MASNRFAKLDELRKMETENRRVNLDKARTVRSKSTNASNQPKFPTFIVLYAEKGGVGKTTTSTTLAFTFAKKNIRTLLYDCDSQRNLTSFIYGNELESEDYQGDLDSFLNDQPLPEGHSRTLYDQLTDDSATSVETIKPAHAEEIIPNLFFVAGHDETYTLDQFILTTEILSKSFPQASKNNYTARPFEAIKKTALAYRAEIVLLDLNPNMGVLNQRIISTSHYMIVPALADSFSSLMMAKLSENIMKFIETLDSLVPSCNSPGGIPIPNHRVKFLGFIISRYIPIPPIRPIQIVDGVVTSDVLRNNQIYWLTKIQEHANILTGLSKKKTPLAIHQNTYKNSRRTNKLAMIREFWGLNEISSIFHTPVPFLEPSHMYRRIEIDQEQSSGEATLQKLPKQEVDKYMKRIIEYRQIYDNLADTIILLIQSDLRR
jgi:cellulose biosynthesis protein BcsQ